MIFIILHIFGLLLGWSMIKVSTTNPGGMKDQEHDIYDQEEFQRLLDQLYNMHIQQEIQARQYRQCKKCINIIKPPRTHHCSQCKACVLKMDHHCQWVDNCIGFYNYKHFFCMLFYATLTLVFMFANYLNCYLDSFVSFELNYLELYLISLTFYFINLALVIVGFLIVFHIILIVNNKTTIEQSEKKKDQNEYDMGFKQNFLSVFGKNAFLWFLPIDIQYESEGSYFQTIDQLV
ncbi:hypothetical protein IMG5_183660 [Ichthyophthirius multifiliis]|uniref:Palmitoyltransferase n=1 Tax=Ichthyophthirius multifiliis TaxID=5932 RepID=G0R377_ICHMU|nr:hypothetical protein IMG5_183660 [Ichthyophthirius multifiliis]EGR28075.1 hypothetical protein IMG5_183660 [Ichthyophthirius multifiliis]|eukprot:XP_004027420.1 hypothetical protein IMG5_183660 [Ichthyophthirius multifiliis]